MFYKFFIVIALFFLMGLPVRGADIQWKSTDSDLFDVVYFEGEITEGDLQKLKRIIELNHWKNALTLFFNSSGGDVFEAVKIGRYIRHKRFFTFVGGDEYCYSACFFSFIGGSSRYIAPKGELGVHQFYGAQGNSDTIQSRTQHLTAELMDYTEEMGVSIETIKIAARTLPKDMYIFSQSEQRRFHLVSDGDNQNSEPIEEVPPISAPKSAERIFWQQDGWKVGMGESKKFCFMSKPSGLNGKLWIQTYKSLKFMQMSYVHKPEVIAKFVKENQKSVKITLNFDNEEENILSADYEKWNSLSSFDMLLQKSHISNLWNYNRVSLSIGSQLVDMIDLKGSAKAFQALNRCYDALP